MPLFERKNSVEKRLLIEDRGASRINRLTQAAISKSTTQQVVELAWTAGPVTLIASVGGYYLGHGKQLPTETLVFFIAYTVIAGVIGLISNVLGRLGRGRKREEAAEQITRVMGKLPDLVLDLRDLQLESLEPHQRKLEAARILLQEVDLGPRWLGSAIRSIGGSAELAEAVEEIDMFRRAGMNCRARDIYQEHLEALQALAAEVRQQLPPLADSLEARFAGDGYDPSAGVPRGRYFIERIFAAIDDEDDTLMTLEDVEEIYTLLYELLCGRRIPMLSFSFAGASRLAKATEGLEERRFRFRIVRARAYSRLLALATYLSDHLDDAALASRAELTGKELLEFCQTHIETLVERISRGRNWERQRLRPILEQALELYHRAYIANRKTEREYRDFQAAVERWKVLMDDEQDQDVVFTQKSGGGHGLQIVEDSIALDDEDKVQVVQSVFRYFLYHRRVHGDYARRARAAKQLAVRIALALDEVIEVRRPEVQRAIYSANTLNMGLFERDMSTKAKVGLGEALAREIGKDMSRAARGLVAAIYRFYGLKLDPAASQQLAERYGSTVEELEQVYGETEGGFGGHGQLPVRPFTVPRAPLEWRLALTRPGVSAKVPPPKAGSI
ncbi:hypothetical protein [Motiliproteus sp. SC1-56]|uniref:hypothetical protein n=1 Tax=Motiliproteus sp. SC1-56 TaxID=2799565 RepID=UPI001A8C2304|nr:hypothetical protein [Motiliproteus sp. SC1-56]